MAQEIYLVKVGMTMTEGTVEEWCVADGEQVEKGQLIYRLETEKVNMDVEAEATGTVKHVVPAGTVDEPGAVIGWIFSEDEEIPQVLPHAAPKTDIAAVGEDQAPANEQPSPRARAKQRQKEDSRILASPVARRLAAEHDLNLADITGSGPRGRITKEDVEQAVADSDFDAKQLGDSRVTVRGMRRTIAQRMFESLQSTAQLTMDIEVSMDRAVQMRGELNEGWELDGVRATYTDLVVKAAAIALQLHPRMNSQWTDGEIVTLTEVNVGIAVALDDGLIVPVIRDAHTKPLRDISVEAARLATAARDRKLTLDEVNNGTFTVTSLGMYGIDGFTPILNQPQTGILGVGRIYDTTQWVGETPKKAQAMRLSLTWDHRVVDGAPAAEFLATVRSVLQAPTKLLL